MGFGWLMDTHKMTLFSKTNKEKKKNPQNLKEADGTSLNIMKFPLFHIHHFSPLDRTEHTFFQPDNLKCTGEKKFSYSK